jgi:hypothetical protein
MSTWCRLHTAAKRADQIRSDRRRCVQIGASLLLRGATATRPGGARAPRRGCARAHCVGVFLGSMAAATGETNQVRVKSTAPGFSHRPRSSTASARHQTSHHSTRNHASSPPQLLPTIKRAFPAIATAATLRALRSSHSTRRHPAPFLTSHTPRPAVAVDLLKTPFFFFCASLRDDQAKIDKARVRF